MTGNKHIRISSEEIKLEFSRILISLGFNREKAEKLAWIFTLNSLDGIISHGVNRFPRFVKNVREGFIHPDAEPLLVHKAGNIEQWDGQLGPGPLNAAFATNRAMEIASEGSIGMVALAHTNHWMRGGTYGWQAAAKGYVILCWTNTCPNMPAWGAKDPRLGNNPLIIGIPYNDNAIVLDFAMSQYSYGKLERYLLENSRLPYPGGFDKNGELTNDPQLILNSWRILPTGYWKGSGLSLVLDILAAILSGGLSTHEIKTCADEKNLSQVFIAIKLSGLKNYPAIDETIGRIISDLLSSEPVNKDTKIRYPGQDILKIRETNLKEGISVSAEVWESILGL